MKSALTGLAVAVTLVACGGGAGPTTTSTSESTGSGGSFSLAVTDAPVDSATSVVVEFSGVSVKPVVGEPVEFAFDEARRIDLLALRGNASMDILTDALLPAGEYEWIRLHVNAEQDNVLDSYIETETGAQLELWIPSGSRTGLKLVRGFTMLAGGLVDFTIDFDLRKSIVEPPAVSGRSVMLKPALRLVDNTFAGSVGGSIESALIAAACADPSTELGAVYVYDGADVTPADVSGADTDPVTTALVSYGSDEVYRYEVGFLGAGDYTLAYTCDAAADDPEAVDVVNFHGVATVTVEEGAEASLDFVFGEENAEELIAD